MCVVLYAGAQSCGKHTYQINTHTHFMYTCNIFAHTRTHLRSERVLLHRVEQTPNVQTLFFFTPRLRFYNIIYCTRAFSQRRCRPNRYAACNYYIIYFYYNIWRVTMRYNSYNRAAVDIIIYLRVFVYDADARVVRALYYTWSITNNIRRSVDRRRRLLPYNERLWEPHGLQCFITTLY